MIASRLSRKSDDPASTETVRTPIDLSSYRAVTTTSKHVQTDVPFDLIAETYVPTQTSMKAGFRTDGADHQSDQEFATGISESRFREEDRFTNKSGDPRIGTHGRTYEGKPKATAQSRAEADE